MLQRVHILEGMKINLDNFDFVKSYSEELYKSFEPVRCPYFNELVYFTGQGLKHLKFKGERLERLLQDQYMRFKLLPMAPLVLKRSGTVQAVSSRQGFEFVRRNNKTESFVVQRMYYEFVAVVEDVRVRIIVKQIDGGQLFFWSIIPYWKMEGEIRAFHLGNPEND